MKERHLRFVFAALLTLTTVEARAQSSLEEARILFDAGAQAFAAGRYKEAVESFSEAYALSGKPQAVFSLAQAERRLYLVSNEPQHLQSSIAHFRKYLEMVPDGGRRNDAVEALEQLTVLATRTSVAADSQGTPLAITPARILVSTTTPGAKIRIDQDKEGVSPLVEIVSPGQHVVRVSAPGYITEERVIVAVEKVMVPLEITLREESAYLSLTTNPGALVRIDGRTHGEAPIAKKIELHGGSHAVVVSLPGHYSRTQTVQLVPGKTNTLDLELRRTTQRITSFVLLGLAGAGFVGAGIQGLVVLQQQGAASGIWKQTQSGNITAKQLADYNDFVATRESIRNSTTFTVVAASMLGIVGALTYSIEPQRAANDAAPNGVSVSFFVGPFVGPSTGGVTVGGRF
jgi:PEGA domain